MLILFVGWGAFFIYTLIRFRQKKNPKADPVGVTNHYSTYAEAGVAVFEILLLIIFSFPVWASRVDEIPDRSETEIIRVVGQQFKWNIHYPGDDGVFGRTLPVGLAAIVGQYQIDWGFLLAGATLASLPVILLFVFVGKYFVSGLTEGAVK